MRPASDRPAGSARPVVRGTRHLVVAGHHLAAQAGMQVLEAGGNAVDAGVAAGIALAVVESDIVSFAGVAPIILYLADRREVVTISGLGGWPRAASAERFRQEHGGAIPPGVLRTVVPAAPDAWITALERYGTMTFGEVAAAAIRFAEDGFPMHRAMAGWIAEHADDYRRWPENARIYLPGGRPPRPGELFVQSDLGRTLRYLADEERAAAPRGRAAGLAAARDAFYRGDVARAIVRYHETHGGLLAAADLADFRVGIEPPVRAAYPGWGCEVYTCGFWCQGPVLLQALNLLEPLDLAAAGLNTPRYVHLVVEALKLAFADRERFYGDPAFVDVPGPGLLSKAYAARRRALIREDRAWPGMPPAGNPADGEAGGPEPTAGGGAAAGGGPRRPSAREGGHGEPLDLGTSYVCVVDRRGNVFSATPSDVSTDTPVIPGTGLAVSSRGSQSRTEPGHPACLAPGKRPRLTPNPAIVFRDGRPWMPIGSPGGDVQSQAMLQVLLNIVVFGLDPQEAVEVPRFATFSFPNSFAPNAYLPGRLDLEAELAAAAGEALAALGHAVSRWPRWSRLAGSVCLITIDPRTGVLSGGADPRRESYAIGW